MIPNRNYKDSVFRLIFSKKEDLLSLYNAMNETNFVVFYNGVDDGVPETSEYRLSDLYELPKNYRERKASREDIDFDLELRVKVLNINAKMHYNIKQQCRTLRDYCIYVEKVRELAKEKTIEEAVEEAITVCIENDVLKDVLINQRAEVKHMSIFEFNEEEEMKKIKEAWKEQGLEEGREEAKGQIIANMFSLGLDKAEIARLVNVTLEQVEECFKRIEDDSNIK